MNAEINEILEQIVRKIDAIAEEKKMVFGRMVDVKKKSPAELKAAKIKNRAASKAKANVRRAQSAQSIFPKTDHSLGGQARARAGKMSQALAAMKRRRDYFKQ